MASTTTCNSSETWEDGINKRKPNGLLLSNVTNWLLYETLMKTLEYKMSLVPLLGETLL